MASYVPVGDRSVTPYLRVRGAAKAIEFYKKAFGAQEVMTMPGPGGQLMHAEIKIGDSKLMLSDEFPQWGCLSPETLKGTTVTIHLFVPDVDATLKQAEAAGGKVVVQAADMFWGDRMGKLDDPFGHSWSIATHKKDMTVEQIQAALKTMGNPDCPDAAQM